MVHINIALKKYLNRHLDFSIVYETRMFWLRNFQKYVLGTPNVIFI